MGDTKTSESGSTLCSPPRETGEAYTAPTTPTLRKGPGSSPPMFAATPLTSASKTQTFKSSCDDVLMPKKSTARDELSGLTRCFNPPKLERKNSSNDLQSRLKTRKILGVGETDNGDIHRSKISQVLGHNEHLYVRFPKGFWPAHISLSSVVTLEAILLLLAPSLASSFGIIPSHLLEDGCSSSSLRLVGAALSGLCVFMWSVLGTTDKHTARTALIAMMLYNVLCVGIALSSTLLQGSLCRGMLGACVIGRIGLCLLSLTYFQQIGEPWSGLPKSSSYKKMIQQESVASVTNTKLISSTAEISSGTSNIVSSASCFSSPTTSRTEVSSCSITSSNLSTSLVDTQSSMTSSKVTSIDSKSTHNEISKSESATSKDAGLKGNTLETLATGSAKTDRSDKQGTSNSGVADQDEKGREGESSNSTK